MSIGINLAMLHTSKRNIFFCGESSLMSTTDETTELNETAVKRTTPTFTCSKVSCIDFKSVCMFCEQQYENKCRELKQINFVTI